MSDGPEVVLFTADGWWAKGERDRLGWWWERISPQPSGFIDSRRRYSQLPAIIETYQPAAVLHALARGEAR